MNEEALVSPPIWREELHVQTPPPPNRSRIRICFASAGLVVSGGLLFFLHFYHSISSATPLHLLRQSRAVCLSISLWSGLLIWSVVLICPHKKKLLLPYSISCNLTKLGFNCCMLLYVYLDLFQHKESMGKCALFVFVITSFNVAQIFFSCAVAAHLLSAITTVTKKKATRYYTCMVWIYAVIVTTLISLPYILLDDDTVIVSTVPICMRNDTLIINFIVFPTAGFLVTLIALVKFHRKMSIYPKEARWRFRGLTQAYLYSFLLCWGCFILLIGLFRLGFKEIITNYLPIPIVLMAVFDLHGFFVAIITNINFFHFRKALDSGLPLKLIAPSCIDLDDTTLLGEGSYGEVYKGILKTKLESKIEVAVKVFKTNVNKDKMREEAYLASKLVHPNILRTYGCYDVHGSIWLVTEYLSGGTLQDLLQTNAFIQYVRLLEYALMIISGMKFLHNLIVPIIHRDLKPENCIFHANTTLKIVDFGTARAIANGFSNVMASGEHKSPENVLRKMTGYIGTVCWTAPEVMRDDAEYSLKTDVYSFGIILWQLYDNTFNRSNPYFDVPGSPSAVEEAVCHGKRPAIAKNCPFALTQAIAYSWHQNPVLRPTFNELEEYLLNELKTISYNSSSFDLGSFVSSP